MSKDKYKDKSDAYVGGGEELPEFDEKDQQIMEETRKEHRKQIVIALVAVVVAAVVVAVYFLVIRGGVAESRCRKLVATYMEGLDEADIDKVESVMDPDTLDGDSSDTLMNIFQTYKDNGIEYSVDYSIGDIRKADSSNLEAVGSTVYGKPADKAGISKGCVVPVSGSIMMTYQGQSSPYDLDMDIICYEKDGEWYLGGTIVTDDSSEE